MSDSVADRPSVSVVMATYNGQRYRPEQLTSIGRQLRGSVGEEALYILGVSFANARPYGTDGCVFELRS